MQILIEAPFDVADDIKLEVHETIKGLEKYHEKITQAHVYFKMDDGTGEDYHTAEIQVHVPGAPIFVAAEDTSPMRAFYAAMEKMEHAMRKAKSIREDKYKQRI